MQPIYPHLISTEFVLHMSINISLLTSYFTLLIYIKLLCLSHHGGVAGTEGGHGERQKTVKKGGGLAAPERASS